MRSSGPYKLRLMNALCTVTVALADSSMRRSRVVVDTVLAGLFVAVMATALVQEAPHEYLGASLFVAVVAHVALNRRWFKALARGRYHAVRIFRLAVIAGLLICVAGQVASALVLSKFVFGFLPVLPGASLARRAHMLCSYWGFVLAFAHVGLQLKGFCGLVHIGGMGDAAGARRYIIWAGRFVFAIIACFGAYSFVHLGFGAYLLGQVQFAVAGYGMSIVRSLIGYASIAVLIAGLFHYLRAAIEAAEKGWRQQN